MLSFLNFWPKLPVHVSSLTWCKKVPFKSPSFALFVGCSILLCIWLSILLDRKLFLCRAIIDFFGQILRSWVSESTLFMRYFVQKVPKTWQRNVPVGNEMPYLDSPHPNTPMDTNLFLLSLKKIFALENHCTHIVLVMWSELESFESFFQES